MSLKYGYAMSEAEIVAHAIELDQRPEPGARLAARMLRGPMMGFTSFHMDEYHATKGDPEKVSRLVHAETKAIAAMIGIVVQVFEPGPRRDAGLAVFMMALTKEVKETMVALAAAEAKEGIK